MKYVLFSPKKLYMPKAMCDEEIQDYISFVYFPLEIIDKASKVYIFECNDKWNQALKETFKPYAGKVVIINEKVDRRHPVDSFLNEIPDIIKIDTEGCEKEIILSSNIILSKKSSVIAATYHNGKDADELKKLLMDIGFNIRFSKGLMIFLYSFKTTYPILRKGLILAKR